ncbi:hypothetical protein AAMO2058_000633800 [Amorphochlora amoebiformis]
MAERRTSTSCRLIFPLLLLVLGVKGMAEEKLGTCLGSEFHVSLDSGGGIRISDCKGDGGGERIMFETSDTPWLACAFSSWTIPEVGMGRFIPEDTSEVINTNHQTLQIHDLGKNSVQLIGELSTTAEGPPEANYSYTLSYDPKSPKILRFSLKIEPTDSIPAGSSGVTHAWVRWRAEREERYYGFGEQYSVWNLRGRKVQILTQEQGVGRGLEPLSTHMNAKVPASAGTWQTSYSSVPHFITSKLKSLYLTTPLLSTFDLTPSTHAELRVSQSPVFPGIPGDFGGGKSPEISGEDLALEITGGLVRGESFLDIVEAYTREVSGRMPRIAKWGVCNGAVIGLQGGTKAVRSIWNTLKSAGVPVSAFWLQDWSGFRKDSFGRRVMWNWELDENNYPGWDKLLKDLRNDGSRVMIYVNPYLTNLFPSNYTHRRLFHEAEELNFLIKNSSGDPYIQSCGSYEFTFGTVDLTNPKAMEWYKTEVLVKSVIASNASGWMADFGEYVPFDAVLWDSKPPEYWHNRFPEMWAVTNNQAVTSANKSDQIIYFMRAISQGSPKHSTMFWAGDQLVSWDKYDGLHSALMATMSGGLSGISMTHSDIGGYTMVKDQGYTRSCELLMRWTELSSITDTLFRTHLGSKPDASEAQVFSTNASLRHFALFARLHSGLCEYRQHLVREAVEKGYPVARHPILHFPHDHILQDTTTQIMLGDLVMFAPVLHPSHTYVDIYLPPLPENETWIRWPTFESIHSGFHSVRAPVGMAAIFLRNAMEKEFETSWKNLKQLGMEALKMVSDEAFDCETAAEECSEFYHILAEGSGMHDLEGSEN